jgi:hypothetical protein
MSCIVAVGIGERYVPYMDRLESTFRAHGYGGQILTWRKRWPPDSPEHGKLHYAFKYYAVKYARDTGHSTILYLDSTCYAITNVDRVFDAIERDGYYLCVGVDILGQWISDKALAKYGVTRDEAMGMKLPAGAIIGVKTTHPAGAAFMEAWHDIILSGLTWSYHSQHCPDRMTSLLCSDAPGPREVISTDPRCLGHRSDEACFGLVMKKLGMTPDRIGNLFEGGLGSGAGCIRCGYDLPAKP